MMLATVNEELRDVYDLHEVSGVLILDPGADHARLDIGTLEEGDRFFYVGNKNIATVEEMVKTLLDEASKASQDGSRVAYDFQRLSSSGSNTQYMRLSKSDIEELRKFSGK